jgi:hypothetical protein
MTVNHRNTIKALGFVEVLIAIVVVGIASAVFLTMSGRAMRELVQTERIEYMARISRDGVTMAQELASKEKNDLPKVNWFPDPDLLSHDTVCYLIQRDNESTDNDYVFVYEGAYNNYDYIEYSFSNPNEEETVRSNIVEKVSSTIEDNPQDYIYSYEDPNDSLSYITEKYFLAMCITDIDDNQQWANVYFWVGDIGVKGDITSGKDVRDLKYYSIIDI